MIKKLKLPIILCSAFLVTITTTSLIIAKDNNYLFTNGETQTSCDSIWNDPSYTSLYELNRLENYSSSYKTWGTVTKIYNYNEDYQCFYIQSRDRNYNDSSCLVFKYASSEHNDLIINEGNLVEITGTPIKYQGLTEFNDSYDIRVLSQSWYDVEDYQLDLSSWIDSNNLNSDKESNWEQFTYFGTRKLLLRNLVITSVKTSEAILYSEQYEKNIKINYNGMLTSDKNNIYQKLESFKNNNIAIDINGFLQTYTKNNESYLRLLLRDSDHIYEHINGSIINVTGINFSQTSITLYEGDKAPLNYNITPNNASNQNVNISISDETVATYKNKQVTALKEGNTLITVTTVDGNFTATCNIKVIKNSSLGFEEPTQEDSPNTLYKVTGSSSSNTSGEAPASSFVTERISYKNTLTQSDIYAAVYNKDGTIKKYLKKGIYYTSIDDVASYILAFKEAPLNYSEGENKKTGYQKYGEYTRVTRGPFGLNSGTNYNTDTYPYSALPKSSNGQYIEYDIGYKYSESSYYASGSSFSRGALRLVVFINGSRPGNSQIGESYYNDNNPVVFYTPNHYTTFYEYANYYNGFGSPLQKYQYDSYEPLTTI